MFQIVEVHGRNLTPVLNPATGKLYLFPDGSAANAQCQQLISRFGKKFQPRRVKETKDKEWRKREKRRFKNKEYIELPWCKEAWWKGSIPAIDHFAHVSVKTTGRVAFTENEEKGIADIQTRMYAGRYLQRYFPDLSCETIQKWALDFSLKFDKHQVEFAETSREIVKVYENGPSSCMSDDESFDELPKHPTYIYGAGDLAVAYLKNSDDEIYARALVWPAKMTYGRFYGDEYRLKAMLNNLGYKHAEPIGARLLKIKHEGNYLMPYLDAGESSGQGYLGVIDKGKHFEICEWSKSEYMCGDTTGLTEKCFRCDRCEDIVEFEDNLCSIHDLNEEWCSDCTDSHAWMCENDGYIYSNETESVEIGGYDYSKEYVERNGWFCDNCDRGHLDDSSEKNKISDEIWCDHCVNHCAFKCEECKETLPLSVKTNDEEVCKECKE